jgi:hypothetical protein
MFINDFIGFLKERLRAIDRFLFAKLTLWQLCGLLAIYCALVHGMWTIPNGVSYQISKNPFINSYAQIPDGQINYDSLVVPLIAYASGLNRSLFTFTCLNFAFIVAAIIFLLRGIRRIWGVDFAKITILSLVLSPLSAILLTWIGSYDSMTFLLQSVLFLTKNWGAVLVLGMLGGFNHLPIMLISGTSFIFFRGTFLRPNRIKGTLLFYWIGLCAGYAALKYYHYHYHLNLTYDRIGRTLFLLTREIQLFLTNWLAAMFSLYNVLWIAVLFILFFLYRKNPRAFWCFIVGNCIFVLLSATTLDTTRVFALLSWPMLIWGLLAVFSESRSQGPGCYLQTRIFLCAVLIAGLIIPRFWVWEGEIHFSRHIDIGRALLHSLNGAPRVTGLR